MGCLSSLCYVFIFFLFVPYIKAQNTAGGSISRFRSEQDRLRCLGVQCPPERPRCITENQVAKCVAPEPIRTVGSRDFRNTRLSRPALGFGSSQRQPSRNTQMFQLNEAERSKSQRNITQISSYPSSKPGSEGINTNLDNVPSYCFERFQRGQCRAYFPRYYYNKETGRCHRFVFGGCGGNRNNFKTEQACKSICLGPIVNSGFNVGLEPSNPTSATGGIGNASQNSPRNNVNPGINNRPAPVNSGFAKGAPPPQPQYCQLNPVRGPCASMVPRYYFNKQTGQCRSFQYSGCGGNRNNFQTLALCKRACDYFDVYANRQSGGRNIPQGPEADILPSNIPLEKFNQDPKNPFADIMNKNKTGTNHVSKGAPRPLPHYCLQTPESGPCYALIPRYYYNKEVGQCRSFAYGGCGGNRNNFQSMTACKRSCDYIDAYASQRSDGNNIPQNQAADVVLATVMPEIVINTKPAEPTTTPSPVPEYCLLPKKVGPCRALIPRFFYNAETKRCEQFGFGGCQPNENNFKSERQCKRRCMAPAKFVENERVTNLANPNGERNTMQHGQLRQFNPVDSPAFRDYLMNQQMNNDIDIIGPSVSGFHVCAQRMDPGTCNLQIRSYYFNASTRSCQPFIFYGCGGNQNRFASLRECHDMCINDSLRPARTP